MQCPTCERQLEQRTVGAVTVDICDGGCGGIWFDQHEFVKFDEPHEEAGQALLDIQQKPNFSVDRNKRLNCPRCGDTIMMRHFFSVKREVQLDECPSCAGIWLDFGELETIRSLFSSEAASEEAAAQHFEEVFGERLAAMRAESAEKAEKARRFASFFRFICPSYFMRGKQDWGAF